VINAGGVLALSVQVAELLDLSGGHGWRGGGVSPVQMEYTPYGVAMQEKGPVRGHRSEQEAEAEADGCNP
jgi:hypothetical protein